MLPVIARLAFPLALASMVFAQSASSPEGALRECVEGYLNALRRGDAAAMKALARPAAARYSPGGTKLGGFLGHGNDRRKLSYFVRHVEMLNADAAFAVGLWRDTNEAAPNPSGAFTLTLVREAGQWKLATVQETLNQPLPALGGEPAPMEKDGEWELLFDGKSTAHLRTIPGGREFGRAWKVEDGCLIAQPGGFTDLRSDRSYRNFEMRWEWMAAKGSNSGVKCRLYGADTTSFGVAANATGWEYQMADDAGDPGAKVDDRQKSGALYGAVAVSKPSAKPAGEWNESRLLVQEDHVEHWLNGVLTVRYPVDFAFESPVLLQHHASEVRFRNVRVRRLEGR